MNRFTLLAITIVLTVSNLAFAAPARIIIIRHGEENKHSGRRLSDRGQERAHGLAHLFTSAAFIKKYGPIAAIFSKSPRNEDGEKISKRSYETVIPTAEALGLEIHHDYVAGEEAKLIRDIRNDKTLDNKTILISWSHHEIPEFFFGNKDHKNEPIFDIANRKKIPREWDGRVFDEMWILDNLPKGRWLFRLGHQGVLPSDEGYCIEKLVGHDTE